jgi:hypothetical protein
LPRLAQPQRVTTRPVHRRYSRPRHRLVQQRTALSGIALPTLTTIARVSLETGLPPETRTLHKIVARARKVSGAGTVTLRSALYERTGDSVSNGRFETNLTGWTAYDHPGEAAPSLTRDTAEFHSGVASMRIDCTTNTGFKGAQTTVSGLTIGVGYVVRCWMKADAGDVGKTFNLYFDEATNPQENVSMTASWQLIEMLATPSATSHTLYARTGDANATFYIDDVEVALENNRSGDLESTALTTSLADYELAIADGDAANIGSYSDLELRFWGYSVTSDVVDVEVAEIYLETPPGVEEVPYPVRNVVMSQAVHRASRW